MKTLILFIMLLPASMLIHSESRQVGPVHPLMPEYYWYINSVRIDADTVYFTDGYEIYRRSADGLKDSIFLFSGAMRQWVDEYSPDGKRISSKDLVRAADGLWVEGMLQQYNEYDSDGRIVSTNHYWLPYPPGDEEDKRLLSSRTYEYTDHSAIPSTVTSTEVDEYIEVKEFSIEYTANGYIFEERTEKTDFAHHTVKRDTAEREYEFDSESRLIRAGHISYSYPEEGGYIEMYYSRAVYYNRLGYPEKFYTWYNDELIQTSEIRYVINDALRQNQTSGAEAVSGEAVYAVPGAVVVQSANPVSAAIYSMDGKLLKKTDGSENGGRIRLPKGFYIVKTEKASYKVYVGGDL